jgi:diacylglycerol kinase family enzyme
VRVAILFNAKAGQLKQAKRDGRAHEILARCREAGLDASAIVCRPARLTATARRIAREREVDAVVAAGGDGTVSAIAEGLVGTDMPLGVIPLGTLNHFARDLGLGDVDAAVEAIAAGRTLRVDVGEVNGRCFVNNSSIGIYPEIVVERERRGGRKWIAMVRAAVRVLLRFPLLRVAVRLADTVLFARTPFVFVGNNPYAVGLGELGSRPRLDTGQLAVYTVRATTRRGMVWALLEALFRRSRPVDLEARTVDRADIITAKRRLTVALDGEVRRMAAPLAYRCRPGALVVLTGAPA